MHCKILFALMVVLGVGFCQEKIGEKIYMDEAYVDRMITIMQEQLDAMSILTDKKKIDGNILNTGETMVQGKDGVYFKMPTVFNPCGCGGKPSRTDGTDEGNLEAEEEAASAIVQQPDVPLPA